MALTTTRLLEAINLKGALAEGQFKDEEILSFAYDSLISVVQPLIIGIREEYFVESVSLPIDSPSYLIPSRAAAQKLRELKIIRGSQIIDLPQILLEDLTTTEPGTPNSFYIKSNRVYLYPTPTMSVADQLQMSYQLRCSRSVLSSAVSVITNVNSSTGVITTSGNPVSWDLTSSFDVNSRVGDSQLRDLIPLATTSTSITLPLSTDFSTITVGSYISLAGETFVLQIPEEAVNLLAMLTVAECLNSMGSVTEYQLAMQRAEQLKADLIKLLKTRVIGSPTRRRPMI